jgi:hypothetical protein
LFDVGKLVVTDMTIRVCIVRYEASYGIELKEFITKPPKRNILFFYKQIKEFAGLDCKKNFKLDSTNYYNSAEFDMPYFIFVVFQTDRAGTQGNDSSQFDHSNLRNMYLKTGIN